MRFVGNLQFGVYLSLAFQTGAELFLILERLAVLLLCIRKLLFCLFKLGGKPVNLLRNALLQIAQPGHTAKPAHRVIAGIMPVRL